MTDPGNPFGAPPAAPAANPFAPAPSQPSQSTPAAPGNPFDPLAAPPADPFATGPTLGSTAGASNAGGPGAGVPAAPPAVNPVPQIQVPQVPAPQPGPQPGPPSYPPQPQQPQYAPQQPQQPIYSSSSALVPSQQPMNPYAGMVPPPQQRQAQPQQQQQQVAAPADPFQATPMAPPAAAAPSTFDPFATAPPPPPQAVVPAPPPQQPPHQVGALVTTAQSQAYPDALPLQQQGMPPASEQQLVPHQPQPPQPPPVTEVSAALPSGGGSVLSEPESHYVPQQQGDMVPYNQNGEREPEFTPQENQVSPLQNRYSHILAREAGPDAAPLPKAEMVSKSGYVLARISFRTIFMKKWKQTFWVQYGQHTMLWFRSERDFDEWLNNPYLTQGQRNFLIKLAVNFVHDLYKPNVRGYQVTQARTKGYGKKLLRQFKLERWMDYGPTIAAAFGSPNGAEVDKLREALIECMRNTPLEGGVRATGAVRQDYPREEHGGENHYGVEGRRDSYGAPLDVDGRMDSANASSGMLGEESSVEPPPAVDLLGGFDDDVSYGGVATGSVPTGGPPQPYVNHMAQPPPQQQPYADPSQMQQAPPPQPPQYQRQQQQYQQDPHLQQQQPQYGAPMPPQQLQY